MLNKAMWNIFKETGNLYAYLYVKEYNKYYYSKNEDNTISDKSPLEIKEITII